MHTTTKQLAVITGPTSGIGMAFAHKFASQGYNLLLVARRKQKLLELSNHLSKRYNIKADWISTDLSKEEDIKLIENKLSSLPRVDILVNNAGFGVAGYFMEVALEEQLKMVNVHITSTIRFCKAVIPAMAEAQKGTIINLASFAAFMELPGSVMYSTTKAAVIKFSQALQTEVKSYGIKIQALCPGFTPTSFHSSINRDAEFVKHIPGFLWTSIDSVVETSLSKLNKKRVVCIPGKVNTFVYWMNKVRILSRWIKYIAQKKQKEQPSRESIQKQKNPASKTDIRKSVLHLQD